MGSQSEDWSFPIRDYLSSLDDQYIVMMMDDSLINKPVNINYFNKLMKFISFNDKTIHRIGLSYHKFYDAILDKKPNTEEYCTFEGVKLYKIAEHAPWRINTSPSIWNRRYLMKMLKLNMTPWTFEKLGTVESRNKYINILAIKDSILSFTESVRRHHQNTIFIDNMSNDDVKYLIENELIDKNINIRTKIQGTNK